jgi:hypothetical protein
MLQPYDNRVLISVSQGGGKSLLDFDQTINARMISIS